MVKILSSPSFLSLILKVSPLVRRLSLYLFKHALIAFVFSLAAVSFVVLFAQSFRFLSFVVDNASTAWVFLQLIMLLIPTILPVIAPIALGVGALFIYHKFASDSELVVMESAGISPFRAALPGILLGIGVTLFGYALTTWLTPAAQRELVALQYSVKDGYSASMIRPGAFNDLAQGLTLYARARGADGGLDDILVHDVRKPEAPLTIMAQKGQFAIVDEMPQIIVFNGKRQEVDRTTGHLSQLAFDRYVLDLQLLRKNSSASRLPDPREQRMSELLNPPSDPTKRRGSLDTFVAELHMRLASPLLALSYVFIAMTAVLAGEFNRRGMGQRVLIAALSIVVLQAMMLSLTSLVARFGWTWPLLYIIVLLPVPICLLLLTGSPRRPKAPPAPIAHSTEAP